jgi:hypothetical protein
LFASLNSLERIVLDAEALAIGQVVGRAAVSPFDDVISDHSMLRRLLRTTRSVVLDPLTSPACSIAHGLAPKLVLSAAFKVSNLRERLDRATIEAFDQRRQPAKLCHFDLPFVIAGLAAA